LIIGLGLPYIIGKTPLSLQRKNFLNLFMDTCLEKQRLLEELFEACSTPESKYEKNYRAWAKAPSSSERRKDPSKSCSGLSK
jgi:hypothetical protein